VESQLVDVDVAQSVAGGSRDHQQDRQILRVNAEWIPIVGVGASLRRVTVILRLVWVAVDADHLVLLSVIYSISTHLIHDNI
jgi:hypothetical protein